MRTKKDWREAMAQKTTNRAVEIGEQVVKNSMTETRRGYNDEIGAYMARFSAYPILTDQEDYEFLFSEYTGDDELRSLRARDLIVYGNIRLVLSIALRHTGRGLSLLDLLQEGVIGLMRAIELFEIQRGKRFSTYASYWIRQGMTRAICNMSEKDPYTIPVHYRQLLQQARRASAELFLESGGWPKPLQVYERMKSFGTKSVKKLGLADVVNLLGIIVQGKVELDAPLYGEADADETNGDRLQLQPAKTETIVEARRYYVEYREAIDRIEKVVNTLPASSAMIMRLRFGLGDFDAMALDEIGERYALSRQRVHQIETKAMKKLTEILGVTKDEIAEIVDISQELEVIAHAC